MIPDSKEKTKTDSLSHLDPQAFAVVIVNFNGFDDTVKCLKSFEAANGEKINVIVVDNGSDPDCSDKLRVAFPWVKVLRNPVNGGWSGGNNLGINEALKDGAQYILLLNNDVVVAPDIRDRLLNAFKNNPKFAIIGPVIRFMDDPEVIMTDGVVFNCSNDSGDFFTRKEIPIMPPELSCVQSVDIVNGCAICIKADVFERIGLIDDRFFLIHEESDFCLRALKAGLQCGVLSEGLVWHKGSSSFQRSGSWLQYYYGARNLALLLQKNRNSSGHARGFISTWINYWKCVWYMYSAARETDQTLLSTAVVSGVSDAICRRFGPKTENGKCWIEVVMSRVLGLVYGLKVGR